MQKWLLLVVLWLSGAALGDASTALPLENKTVCRVLGEVNIGLEKNAAAFLPDDMRQRLSKTLQTKVTAYRIQSSCNSTKVNAFIFMDVQMTTPISDGKRAYIAELRIITGDLPGEPGLITLWRDVIYGLSSQSAPEQADNLVNVESQLIDNLAADWAVTNP